MISLALALHLWLAPKHAIPNCDGFPVIEWSRIIGQPENRTMIVAVGHCDGNEVIYSLKLGDGYRFLEMQSRGKRCSYMSAIENWWLEGPCLPIPKELQ